MNLTTIRHPNNPCALARGAVDVPVHARQWYEFPGRQDGVAETWCYSDRIACGAGERVTLHGISTAERIHVTVEDALGGAVVYREDNVPACWQETPANASVQGCDWPAIAEIPVSADWPSAV